jgi:hypothetical protein
MKTPQALVGRRLQTLVFVLVGGLMLPSSLSSQTLLNVNFAAYNNVKIGFAATGLTADDFWNNYTAPFQSFAWLSDLTMANGTRSSVGLTVQNGAGHWTFTFPDLMYDCYSY